MTDLAAAGLYPVMEQTGARQSLMLCFHRACRVDSVAMSNDRTPQAEERRLWLVVVTREVTMSATFRAFLYGLLILAAALIPPTISVVKLLENLVGS
jgi:hypothetical protein